MTSGDGCGCVAAPVIDLMCEMGTELLRRRSLVVAGAGRAEDAPLQDVCHVEHAFMKKKHLRFSKKFTKKKDQLNVDIGNSS